jgi:hypothetical protein
MATVCDEFFMCDELCEKGVLRQGFENCLCLQHQTWTTTPSHVAHHLRGLCCAEQKYFIYKTMLSVIDFSHCNAGCSLVWIKTHRIYKILNIANVDNYNSFLH